MDDLISRKAVIEYIDKRRMYELMAGRNKAYGKGVRDAIKDIENQPSVPSVPLDKLCEWLAKNASWYATEIDGDPEEWKSILTEWMEENTNDTK